MRFLVLLALCGMGAAIAAEIPRPIGDTSIVDPEAKFELLSLGEMTLKVAGGQPGQFDILKRS